MLLQDTCIQDQALEARRPLETRPFCKKALALFVSAAALVTAPALAQQEEQPAEEAAAEETDNAYTLGEVTVTAQRRSQNLQEVPISITAFTEESLQRSGITNVAEIADFAPNVQIDTTAPFSGLSSSFNAFIRGVGQSDFALNFDPGVGLYVDGIYYGRTVGSVIDLLDIERIEVLKGPQGTLFGRNTIGGAVNVTTRDPTEDFEGRLELIGGSFDRLDFRGAVSIPLIEDKLGVSLAFSSKTRDGFQERIPFTGPDPVGAFPSQPDVFPIEDIVNSVDSFADPGNENNQSFRGKIVWDVTDRFRATLAGDYTRIRESAPPSTLLDTFSGIPGTPNFRDDLPPGTAVLADVFNGCIFGLFPVPGGCVVTNPVTGTTESLFGVNVDADPDNNRTPFDDRFITGDIDTSFATGNSLSNIDTWGAGLTFEYDLTSNILFKSITAVRGLTANFGSDIDGSPLLFNETSFLLPQTQISQELQLSGVSFADRLKWVVGFYYFTEDGDPVAQVPFAEGLIQVIGPNFIENTSFAGFGQATFDVTDRFAITLGGRITREERFAIGGQMELNNFNVNLGVPPEAFPVPEDTTILAPPGENLLTFTDFSPRVALEYKVTDDIFVFASYASGFKSGGFDLRPSAPILELPSFDEETADSIEAGIRSTLFNGKLRANLTGFFVLYDDLQQVIQIGISPFTENAAEAELYGLEFDFEAVVTDNFRLSGTVGFLENQFTDIDPASVVEITDVLPNAPRWSASLSADYFIDLPNNGTMNFHGDVSYSSETQNNPENTPILAADERVIVGISATYTDPNDRFDVFGGARNLTNERFIASGFDQIGIGFTEANFNRPREWFAGLRYRF